MDQVTKLLLNWYQNNQRNLPWRNQHNPYQTWLSEIILQQTRVDQGTAYFHKFVDHFPSVNDLANASEEEVLKLWQGLGYYSRARNLHKTAKIIRDEHQSQFPKTSVELQKLPGVGPYTSAAIASIAFNEPTPVVDGNVQRVISRLLNSNLPVNEKAGHALIWDEMDRLIPASTPGDFNQAVMELGATLCSPTSPKCHQCPVQQHCLAHRNDTQDELPIKLKKTKVKEVFFDYIIPIFNSEIFAKQRLGKGIWQNMYDFPLLESVAVQTHEQLITYIQNLIKEPITIIHQSEVHTHLLSHRKIQAKFTLVELKKRPDIQVNHGRWMSLSNFQRLPHPKLVEKIIPALNDFVE